MHLTTSCGTALASAISRALRVNAGQHFGWQWLPHADVSSVRDPLLVPATAAILLTVLKDPRVRDVHDFRHNRQIVAVEALRAFPALLVLVKPLQGDVLCPHSRYRIAVPDRELLVPRSRGMDSS